MGGGEPLGRHTVQFSITQFDVLKHMINIVMIFKAQYDWQLFFYFQENSNISETDFHIQFLKKYWW